MKKCLSLLLVFITFQISAQTNCENKVQLSFKGKKISLCHNKETETYSSEGYVDIASNFFIKDFKLTYYKNQGPGFSICYQLGGEAFFGSIEGLNKKIPLCRKKGFIVDQESLLVHYRDNVLVR
jgi:hypothetical protein